MNQETIELGKYKHFKGMLCEVIGVASDSETLEPMVVYRELESARGNEAGSLWVRPLKMFKEKVVRDGKEMPRFTKIDN